ncbi:MAG: CARDB domain-containing protein [Anaerolineales bacterium]|jgi:hypothetical protein
METEHAIQKPEQPEEQVERATVPGKFVLYRYIVKFVCGKSGGEVVAPGRYYTAINVENPSERVARIRKRFSIALPGEMAGPVSEFFLAKLGPYEAMEIDCGDIFQHTRSRAGFLKGFALIESRTPLEVVAVYTAAGAQEYVETLHIERVAGQRVTQGLPDLIPVPDPEPGVGFCRLDEEGNLVVHVKNQGSAAAGASTTRVEFSPGGVFDLYTAPIPPGVTIKLPAIPIPGECYNPDCDFRITVDVKGELVESNEANNTGSGRCIG